MPLIIETDKCVGQDPSLNYHVAMAMMNTGIQSLPDQAAADELYIRYRMMHLALNTLQNDRYLTYAEISSFVGCTTNVSKKTPTQWNKQIAEAARESAITILRRHQKAEANV